MHIDMNSYFASCEQQDNSAWRGQPLGVCEHLGGIIIAPSVEAKRWGVKTGTPVWEAKKLCPQIILTTTTPDRYRHYTVKFLKVFEDYTKDIERYSIDEAFLDVTRVCGGRVWKDGSWQQADPFEEAVNIGREIKQRLQAEVGDYLRCSVGIAQSKLLAKIGSDMQKPDGLVVLRPEDKAWLYKKLALTDIPGIGTRQAARLVGHGVRTLEDLRNCPAVSLVRWFGVMGYHLWSMGQLEGSWHEEFGPEAVPKSVGHMYTVAQEFRGRQGVAEKVLSRLSEMVARRLRLLGLGARAVSGYMVEKDYAHRGGVCQLGAPTADGSELFQAARLVVLRTGPWPKTVYRVGITAIDLAPLGKQLSLFTELNRRTRVAAAIDKINAKYGQAQVAVPAQRSALGNVPGSHRDAVLPGTAFFAQDIIRDSVGFAGPGSTTGIAIRASVSG
jgi:DNA polymerase-4